MKRIELERLKLLNFKGAREVDVTFGHVTRVYGENGVGKTTLFDAFAWLLFSKDSQGKSDFEIKTLDASGNVIPMIDHEVEGTLRIDGQRIVLRKVYAEKWTKKRGSATSEFSGHSTDYYIDGVPVKLNEYKARIAEIVDEELFKLLTSPAFFNEQLTWQQRRKILLDVCGDLRDAEVIAASDKLAKLPSLLGHHEIDDYRKIIAARRTAINKEIQSIPVRIDEATRSKPHSEGSEADLMASIEADRATIAEREAEIQRLQTGGEIAEQEKRIREIESQMIDYRNKRDEGALDRVRVGRQEIVEFESAINRLDADRKRAKSEMESGFEDVSRLNVKVDALRKEWAEVNAETFTDPTADVCATCGQLLPADEVAANREKALATFNRSKSQRLEGIIAEANRTKERITEIGQRQNHLEAVLKHAENDQENLRVEMNAAKDILQKLQDSTSSYETEPAYKALAQAKEAILAKIGTLRSHALGDIEKLRTELMDVRERVRKNEQRLASFAQIEVINRRIEDLKRQEKALAAEYEELEEAVFLTEEFMREKVNMLESRINSKFRFARFKLFDRQVNGALADTCETTYGGVPYGSGLNNGARINVGVDIVNTLSDHHGIYCPAFLDNAEAVTAIIPTKSQTIALYVSASDKVLRVEHEDDGQLTMEAI